MTAPARKPRAVPDNQPFDFNLDAVEAEIDLTPWRVHFGGRRWEFKHPQAIDVWGLMAEDEKGSSSEISAMIGVFTVALGEEQYAEFRKIPLPSFRLKALFEAYQQYGGVEPGESEGSDDS